MMHADDHEIPVETLPAEIRSVVEAYTDLLRHAPTLDEVADHFTGIAGGSIINAESERMTLRTTIKNFSLKKDYSVIKSYIYPAVISKVCSDPSPVTAGYGASAITGRTYKVWIKKINNEETSPGPLIVMMPQNHPVIRTPKIILMGSF